MEDHLGAAGQGQKDEGLTPWKRFTSKRHSSAILSHCMRTILRRPTMNDDPIVASVRKIREDLAAAFDYDVHAIFATCVARGRVGRPAGEAVSNTTAEPSDAPERRFGRLGGWH